MDFDKNILREADIRGIYKEQIGGDFAYRLGLVFGTFVLSKKKKEVIVGHDNRFGWDELSDNLIKGLKETGVNIFNIGLVTTPILNYAARALECEYGIMVTASHNPKDNNGFKLFGLNYQHMDHDELHTIYDALSDEKYKIKKGKGKVEKVDILEKYYHYLNTLIHINKNYKVVVDAGNGVASTVIRDIFKYFDKLDVDYLFCESDPNFPNHHPDPSVKENLTLLSKRVKKVHADLGIAYDGDADRFGIVDEKGNVIPSDIIVALMCEYMFSQSKNRKVLMDIKCSNALKDEIERLGGEVVMASASSAEEERIIVKENILFGGSLANHIFFHDDHPGYDDGIYGGLRFIEYLQTVNKPLSKLPKKLNKYYNTEEIKVKTKDDIKFEIINKVKEYAIKNGYEYQELDGIKIVFPYGWALLRASNTGPNFTLRFEASKKSKLAYLQKEFMDLLYDLQNKM